MACKNSLTSEIKVTDSEILIDVYNIPCAQWSSCPWNWLLKNRL